MKQHQANISHMPVFCRYTTIREDEPSAVEIEGKSKNPGKKSKPHKTARHSEGHLQPQKLPAASSDRTLMISHDEEDRDQRGDWERAQEELAGWNERMAPSPPSSARRCTPPSPDDSQYSSRRSLLNHILPFRTKKKASVYKSSPYSATIAKSKEDTCTTSCTIRGSDSCRRCDAEPHRLPSIQKPAGKDKWFVRENKNPSLQTSRQDHVMQMVFFPVSMTS
jgi:hypothetical protein